MVAAAVIGGAVVGGLATSYAGNKSASAQEAGADTAAASQDRATELQSDIYKQGRQDQLPWLQSGATGLNALMALSGLPQVKGSISTIPTFAGAANSPSAPANVNVTPWSGVLGSGRNAMGMTPVAKIPTPAGATPTSSNFQIPTFSGNPLQQLMADPSYQFRLSQGEQALERSAAARGGLGSGGFAKDMTNYAQGAASNEYGNVWNRLASIAGVGQSTAQNLGAQGQSYGNQAQSGAANSGNAAIAASNARASGYINQSNALNDAINNGFQTYKYYTQPSQSGAVTKWNQ